MELLIIEDMYDVAIPTLVMKDSSTFQCDSFVRGYHILGASGWRVFE